MPRTARVKSEIGIYHVMLRGSNRQQIFYDDEDNEKFVDILKQTKETSGFELYAYCLMGNHVHLLLKEKDEPLETIFKRIGAAFVYWYNLKYERVGHLFQDRYKSEPVNDEAYFMTALRYILQNPVKAGLCASPDTYAYSSGKEYFQGRDGITDIGFAQSIAGKDNLMVFLTQNTDKECMDLEKTERKGLTDAAASRLITEAFGTDRPSAGKPSERETFNLTVSNLLNKGISIRQLSRLTGLSKKIIESCND